MILHDDFEHGRASLHHHKPLPTLDTALAKLLSTYTKSQLMHCIYKIVLTTPHLKSAAKNQCHFSHMEEFLKNKFDFIARNLVT